MFSVETLGMLPEWFSDDEIRNINSMIRVSSSRSMGLSIMNKVLMQSDADLIINHGISWLKVTFEIVAMPYESESIRLLAAKNFCQILKVSSKISQVARSISLDHINIIFRKLLDYDLANVIPCLKCFKSILKYYPGPLGEFKGKLVKFLAPLMSGDNPAVQNKAIKCWCFVPIIGGGGKDRKEHGRQWEKQFQEVLESLIYVCNRIFENNCSSQDNTSNEIDPSLQSLSLSFQEIPITEPQLFYSLHNRYVILCKCICSMLQSRHFSSILLLPLDKLMSCLILCCSTSFQTFGYTSEMRLRARYLANFHKHSLEILKVLIQNFSQDISQSANVINHLVLSLFSLWNQSSTKDEYLGDCSIIRGNLYDVLILWVQSCGWKSKFMCDENMCKLFLRNLVDDMTFQTHAIDSKWELEQMKKKSRKTTESTKIIKTTIKLHLNSSLRINALKVAKTSIYSHGTRIPAFVHKTLQETVINLLLQMLHLPEHVYNQCDDSRIELYRLLLALCVGSHHTWPPPIHFAVNLFKQASSYEKCLSARVFLIEASTTLSHIVRPRAPSLHRPNVNFIEEYTKKYSNITEPHHNISFSLERQHIKCVDAQTSTDDLVLPEFSQGSKFKKQKTESQKDISILFDRQDIKCVDAQTSTDDLILPEFSPCSQFEKQNSEDLSFLNANDVIESNSDSEETFSGNNLLEKSVLIKEEQTMEVDEQNYNTLMSENVTLSNDEISVSDMMADFVNVKPDDHSLSGSD